MNFVKALVCLLFMVFFHCDIMANRIWNEMQGLIHNKQEFRTFELVAGIPPSAIPVSIPQMPGRALYSIHLDRLQSVLKQAPEYLSFQLKDGYHQVMDLLLIRQEIFSEDAAVIRSDQVGIREPIDQTALYYRGIIKQFPGSFVAITLTENEIMGVLSTPERGNLVLGKIQTAALTENEPAHVLYYENELPAKSSFQCGSEGLPEISHSIDKLALAPDSLFDYRCKTIKVFLECDYRLYTDRNSQKNQVTTYVSGLFNVVKTLYYNEYITLEISEFLVWTTPDPFLHSDLQSILFHYSAYRKNDFNGNLAQLVTTYPPQQQGGIAWLGTLCQPFNGQAGPHSFAYIYNSYSALPTYSWSVEVMTHEMGHNLGSPHTHACQWGPNRNMALDNCQNPEGNLCSPGPAPNGGGTIMSYCHLTGYGINFTKGFGEEPGNLIRNNVENRSCLSYRIVPSILESSPAPYFEGDTVLLKARPQKSLYTYDWYHYDYLLPTPKDSNFKVNYSGIFKLAVSDRCTEFSNPDTIEISDFLVNLGCPVIPGMRDSVMAQLTMNADQGVQSDSLIVSDSLYKKIPVWARDVLVELQMQIEPQGNSWTRDVISAYQSPANIGISNSRYAPNAVEPASFKGIKTYKRILGKFNPKGSWYFTTNDNKFDNGIDAKVKFSIVISWRSKDSVAPCELPICDGESRLFDAKIKNAKYQWSTGDSSKTIQINKAGPLSITVTRGNQTAYHQINLFDYNTHYQQEFTICSGDSLSVGPHVYVKSGVYLDTLQSFNACDSIIQTRLNVLENKQSNQSISICYADSFRSVSYVQDTLLAFHYQAANGCDSTEWIQLNVNPELNIDFVSTPECPETGGRIDAVAGGGSGSTYQYHWNQGATESGIKGLASGIYTLEISDSIGCKLIQSVELKNLDSLIIRPLVFDVSCFGKEDGKIFLDFSSGKLPITINWAQGGDQKQLTELKAGKYTVFARDDNGCLASTEIEVRTPELLFVLLDVSGSTGSDGSAKTNVSGGTPPYTYFWSTGEKNSEIRDLAPGDYWVYVYDKNGCESRIDFTIPVIISTSNDAKESFIQLVPNPVKNNLTIQIQGIQSQSDKINWLLYDIHSNLISQGNGLNVVTENLISGSYVLHIQIKDQLFRKLVLKI